MSLIRDLKLLAQLPVDCWSGKGAPGCVAGRKGAMDHFAMADEGLRKLTLADLNVRASLVAPLPGGGATVAVTATDVAVTGGLMSFVLPRLFGHPPQEIVTEGPPILEERPKKPTSGKALDTMVEDPAALPRPVVTILEGVRQMIASASPGSGEDDEVDGGDDAGGAGDGDAAPSRRPGRPGAARVSIESLEKAEKILDGFDLASVNESMSRPYLLAVLAAMQEVIKELTSKRLDDQRQEFDRLEGFDMGYEFDLAEAIVQIRDEIDFLLVILQILGGDNILSMVVSRSGDSQMKAVLIDRLMAIKSYQISNIYLGHETPLDRVHLALEAVREARGLEKEEDFIQAALLYADAASLLGGVYEEELKRMFYDRFSTLYPMDAAREAIKAQLPESAHGIDLEWLSELTVAPAVSGAVNNQMVVVAYAEEAIRVGEVLDDETQADVTPAKILITAIIQFLFDQEGMDWVNQMLDADDRERSETEDAVRRAGREPIRAKRLCEYEFIRTIIQRLEKLPNSLLTK